MSTLLSPKDIKEFNIYIKTKCPWLNKFLFEELIRRDNPNENVIVETYSLMPAIPRGENCASEVIRAKVIYSTEKTSKKNINFVIKIQKSGVEESFKQNELFLREIAVYRDILPRAEELLRSINDETRLSAKYEQFVVHQHYCHNCYNFNHEFICRCYVINSSEFYLIFEDLCATGYRNHDKKVGLTVESYKSVFSTLAKWHATTAVLFDSVS